MIITSLHNKKNLNMLLAYSDAVMAGNDLTSVLNLESYSVCELKEIISIVKNNNKKFILKLNGMLHEDQIEMYKSFILEFDEVDYYYVQDLGVSEILNDLGYKEKVIYDPVTMICNSLDAQIYKEQANILGLSMEITLNDAIAISKSIDNNSFYKIFGYHQMCFSKRKLISLYLEENKIKKLGDLYYLKEEKREDFYPIFERDYGTIILRSHVINLMKHISELSFKFFFIETILIEDDKLLTILKLFNDLINNNKSTLDAISEYEKLNILTSPGFSYEDSVYLKEEMKNV